MGEEPRVAVEAGVLDALPRAVVEGEQALRVRERSRSRLDADDVSPLAPIASCQLTGTGAEVRSAAAGPSTEMNWYPVALATGSTPGSLHATWSAYGRMVHSDAAFPAGSTLDDLEADLTWKGSDVTVSDPVLHSPLVALTSVIDQLHAGTSPSQISAIDPGAVEAVTSQDLPIDGKSSADLLSTMSVTDTGSCQAGDDVAETTGADAAASTTFICTISGGGQGELGVSATARRDAPGQYVLTYLHVITG